MKRSLILVLTALAALALKADVMNWQVADDNLASYNYAKLYYTDTATTAGGTVLASSELDEGYGDVVQIDLSTISGGANSKYFYIEVGQYKDTFQVAQRAGAYSYSDLVSAGLISTGSMNPPSGLSFGQSGVTIAGSPMSYAVPEPSSAMLILVGLAVAGLKRRRA